MPGHSPSGFFGKQQNSWFHLSQQVFQVLKQQNCPRPSHYSNTPNPHEISMTVIKVIKHPKYNKLDSSIAMLQLCSSVTFTDYMKPVCLAAGGSVFAAGTESWVTGWGLNEGEEQIKLPDILKEVEAPVVGNIECSDAYEGIITDSLMCAGFLDEGEKAPCEGDAGSSLVTRQGSIWIQSGVAVYFDSCGAPSYPALYNRVSEYQDWIGNYTTSSEPGFVPYLILFLIDGGSVSLLSFSLALAFSIIPLIFFHFF
ncbi:serine protease 27-like [Cyprinus carpio]|uniref:Serine protease 27-like n=1 Tax=Cyprinus carpio TaxID=7962 RepID=A0A9Q9W5W3_CYPCA|nr:serine protease 27-like [Cyprinus carpio]